MWRPSYYTTLKGKYRKYQSGLTLIDITIAVVIIGLLVSIAYPTYVASVRKSRRADAKAALMAVSQQLERYYTQQNTYVGATLGGSSGIYPATSQNGYYTLALPSANLTTSAYTITATPRGAQSSDECGTFTLDAQGNQGVTGGTVTDASQCW